MMSSHHSGSKMGHFAHLLGGIALGNLKSWAAIVTAAAVMGGAIVLLNVIDHKPLGVTAALVILAALAAVALVVTVISGIYLAFIQGMGNYPWIWKIGLAICFITLFFAWKLAFTLFFLLLILMVILGNGPEKHSPVEI